ncbi:hypothetical protein GIB67_034112 [Kingdonia uniflora]|uniref:Uncharacterized protein n=1 Tax=Kingdonia uniflora TaxID=39325 RepID=A0A7J7M6C0_9MAGN|nr:hypothetical protein GIB67_034112 [Kingdonia uniflora]
MGIPETSDPVVSTIVYFAASAFVGGYLIPKDLIEIYSMRSKPINPMSKFVVASSSDETSSSGREGDCNVIKEIVDKVEVIVGAEFGESSKLDKVIGKEDTKKKDKIFFIYPEGVDVEKEYLKHKKEITRRMRKLYGSGRALVHLEPVYGCPYIDKVIIPWFTRRFEVKELRPRRL